MKKINSETQLYTELARRGDPTAFYALLHEHIRSLYVLLRSQGKNHETALTDASKTVETLYGRFTTRPPGNPVRWFAGACKVRKFDAGAAGVAVSLTEAEEYDKAVTLALHRYYSDRLDRGSDSQGNLKSEHPFLPYIVGAIFAAGLAAFLFFSEAAFSVSFGRFGSQHVVSFPKIAESLWSMSGLVRAGDNDNHDGKATEHPATEPADSK
ncbi:MAG: hypothetical protein FWB85_11720 [Chitinispirillia bacterium]|nr:hypothetical protein [Chitinispirillia bacterium]MCL2184123.1 hypothetical protein [Chitinispirillia bacterium]MCL2269647.1 hypothetical protein [Chitinispirillia bacterium]